MMTLNHAVEILFDTAIKSIGLMGMAAIMLLAWRRGAAATRHFAWLGAALSLLLLPLAPLVAPRWTAPAWASHAALAPGWMSRIEANAPPNVSVSAPANRLPPSGGIMNLPVGRKPGEAPREAVDFRGVVLWGWIAGVGAALLGCLGRSWRLRQLERNCRLLNDSRVKEIFRAAQAGLRLKRNVRLLAAENGVMPMTWGWWRAVVLLPAQAANWEDSRLEMVLRHELAHVKRWDCLTQSLAEVVCAIYWFNPLVWLASRQMRAERERACDDLVLTAGARPSDYAGHLLEIARQFGCSDALGAIPMARPSGLERRLRAVVDGRREHGGLRPLKTVFVIAALAGLFCCVGGWKTAAADNATTTPAEAAALRNRQMAQIEAFSKAKEKQSEALAASAGEKISPIFQRFFDAAIRGDSATVTNMYADFKNRHPQYSKGADGRSVHSQTVRAMEARRMDAQIEFESYSNILSKLQTIKTDLGVEKLKSALTIARQLDPELVSLSDRLLTAKERMVLIAEYYGPKNPEFVKAQVLLTNTQAEFDQKFGGVITGLKTRLDAARDHFNEIEKRENEILAAETDFSLRTSYWQPVLEICLAYFDVAAGEPKYTQLFVDGITDSIPPGSVYFGGTDPGRGLITAFSKSHAGADPFFTLTQNSLADNSYLQYLQTMYGSKLYIPTADDSQNKFAEYLNDAEQRLAHDAQFPNEPHQIKPGENVENTDGSIHVSGQVAVVAINGLLAKLIFDKNPGREFYVEESFPLDWMYPHLEPHGIIMKINRDALPEMTGDIVKRDQDYWGGIVSGMVGDWLAADTPVRAVADFVERTYARQDLSNFRGDPRFIDNDDAMRMFSKQRSNIGGLYAWRMNHPSGDAEKDRMGQAADLAFRQAWVICPYSPETVFQFVNLLTAEQRMDDALLVADTADRVATLMGEPNPQLHDLAEGLRRQRK
jgi:beta-lactamase regulating signal transducer with metallopeptidase domain